MLPLLQWAWLLLMGVMSQVQMKDLVDNIVKTNPKRIVRFHENRKKEIANEIVKDRHLNTEMITENLTKIIADAIVPMVQDRLV